MLRVRLIYWPWLYNLLRFMRPLEGWVYSKLRQPPPLSGPNEAEPPEEDKKENKDQRGGKR